MRDRLAAESPEERDSRLQNMSILHRQLRPLKKGKFYCNVPLVVPINREQSLFKQHLICSSKYHSPVSLIFDQLHMHHVMCTT